VVSLAGAACSNGSDDSMPDSPDPGMTTTETTGTSGVDAVQQETQPVAAAELPATASPLPLIAGFGVLALAGAAGIRLLR
jgi:hypothetical protein